MMTDPSSSRWPALFGFIGGTALGVGSPYLILTYGSELSMTVRILAIILALAAGGRLARAGRAAATTHLVETNAQRRLP